MELTEQIEWLENILRVAKTLPNEVEMGSWQSCGTPHCLWGHCAVDPWFSDRGLRLTGKTGWAYKGEPSVCPERVLDIPMEDADWMFMTGYYTDKDEVDQDGGIHKASVIEHVETILTKYQKEAA